MSYKDNLIVRGLELGFSAESLQRMCSHEIESLLASRLAHPNVEQLTVMLAKSVKHMPDHKFQALLRNPYYVVQPKLDGIRCKLHFSDGRIWVDSRHRSIEDFGFIDKTENFPFLRDDYYPQYEGTVLDAEMMSPVQCINYKQTRTTSWVTSAAAIFNSDAEHSLELQAVVGTPTFYVFDILKYKRLDVRALPLCERWPLVLEFFYERLPGDPPAKHLQRMLQASIQEDAPADRFFRLCTAEAKLPGCEGIMLKNSNAPYSKDPNSRTSSMYKWKNSEEIDCFVSGSEPGQGAMIGLVGSLYVSAFFIGDETGPHVVGAVSPGDMALRKEMTRQFDDGLKPEFLGRVCQVSFQEWTKNGLMRHAVLERWRPDKQSHECIIPPPYTFAIAYKARPTDENDCESDDDNESDDNERF